jgi:hypothetical protein
MYDPLVVDTFLRIHRDLASPEAIMSPQADTYADIARLSAPEPPETLDDGVSRLAYAVSELLSLTDGASVCPEERAASILSLLVRTLNGQAGFIAVYDGEHDDLVITAGEGLGSASVVGSRVALGECISGWVAANKKSIINSDAALDLAALAPSAPRTLSVGLSVPLFSEPQILAGVLSFYSRQAFTPAQLNAVQALSPAVARILFDGALQSSHAFGFLPGSNWSSVHRSGLLRLPFEG